MDTVQPSRALALWSTSTEKVGMSGSISRRFMRKLKTLTSSRTCREHHAHMRRKHARHEQVEGQAGCCRLIGHAPASQQWRVDSTVTPEVTQMMLEKHRAPFSPDDAIMTSLSCMCCEALHAAEWRFGLTRAAQSSAACPCRPD